MIESIYLFLPEIFLSVVALLLFGIDSFVTRRLKEWVLAVSLFALLITLCLVLFSPSNGRAFGLVVSDGFSSFFKVLALVATAIVFLLSEKDDVLMGRHAGSYAGLILLSTIGVMFLSSAEDLLILFIGLELTTVPLFILAGFLKKRLESSEGAIKFFLVGVFSTGLMIYGMSFLYGLCGSTHFSAIREWYLAHSGGELTLFLVGLLFFLAGLGFKLSLVPFHQWTPDTYEGSPTPITAFFSISREAGAIVVMLRFFGEFIPHTSIGLTHLFALLSVLTMTIGNITALLQRNLKRLLAYSSIAHAGTIFIGLVAENLLGRQGVMLYCLAYSLMSLGAFAVVIAVSRIKNSDDIESIQGLGKEHFPMALMMLFFLLSLSGIPPFLGFLGKFYVFAAAIKAELYWLVAAGLINSVISVYYYFRIAHGMFFKEPKGESGKLEGEFGINIAVLLTAAVLLISGIFPQKIIAWVHYTSHLLP